MTDEDLFEAAPAESAVSAPAEDVKKEKKVVRAKRTIRVRVKAQELQADEQTADKTEAQAAPEAPAAAEAPVSEQKPKRKPVRRTRKKTEEAVPAPQEDENQGTLFAETPAPAEEVKTEEVPAAEAPAPAEEGEKPQEEEAGDAPQKFSGQNGRFQNNRKNRNKNSQNMKRREEIIEVSLEENPDAPQLFISFLTTQPLDTLREMAREKGITEEVILDCRKQDLIREMSRLHSANGGVLMVEGTIEILSDGYGFLRYSINSYLSGTEDVYLSSGMIRGCGLRTGDTVFGQVRTPRENDKFYSMFRVMTVNGDTPQMAKLRVPFDTLTPLFPDEKLNLQYVSDPEKPEDMDIATRVVDLFSPIGKGQRSLIVAPPRTGKTVLMQKIANAITTNHPEVKLFVLLVDERPEEVTDMRRNVKGEVVASTFDEQATRHVQVAEMVIEKAKRLVEQHKDVVILLDSITRLARAYNQTVPASGKILSGGVDSNALHKPKRFFGAARNIENGGSLTIISTALIETGSRMDEVIFEEFKGTGNNEIVLDRRMADARKFPAINIKKSGTRRDDLLLSKDELSRLWLLRNAVANMDDLEMSTFLIDKMKKTHNNKEFLGSMSGSAAGAATQMMTGLK
ncbi:MAG: transcription termination factor Rho [Bullifex sp.]|nr:transcription termination factor Rho [Bullifex sp.]MDY3851178.1 transcription termination factor Rho [Bullifex sp.]